jgi:hypothetical protein
MRAYKPHSPRYAVTRVTPDTHFNGVALSFQTLRLTLFTKVRLGAEVPGCRQQQSTLLWTALRRCSVSGNQTEWQVSRLKSDNKCQDYSRPGLNLNSVNQLIFVMVKYGVLFEVRTEFLNNI